MGLVATRPAKGGQTGIDRVQMACLVWAALTLIAPCGNWQANWHCVLVPVPDTGSTDGVCVLRHGSSNGPRSG